MRILIVTPLYPPDIAMPAPYVKELAKRLKGMHEISILAYNHIPEKIDGVRIVTISKDIPLLLRIIRFTRMLFIESKNVDLLFVQNGSSVEVPFSVVKLFSQCKSILYVSDAHAYTRMKSSFLFRIIFFCAQKSATHVSTSLRNTVTNHSSQLSQQKETYVALPHREPEVHSLFSYPHDERTAYETSWSNHINELTTLFSHI